jgi:hypothetical protein
VRTAREAELIVIVKEVTRLEAGFREMSWHADHQVKVEVLAHHPEPF